MMDDAYQSILRHHKQSLQNQLEYDERLAKAVVDEHLLPPAALREVEKEMNKSKRLLVFLSKLTEQQDNGVFRKFISVLERSGYGDIAASLRADISKVHFDFQRSKHCTTICDLADHVASDILPRLCSEQDPLVVQALIKELDDSMNKIRLIEREKSKYIKRLAKIVHIADTNGSAILGSVSSTSNNDDSLEEMLYNIVKDKLEAADDDKKHLMEHIEKLKKELAHHSTQNDAISKKQLGSEMSRKEDVAYLAQVIRKQDEELLSLRSERRSSQQEYVQIPRKQYDHLVSIMSPYTRRRMSPGAGGSSAHNNNNDSDDSDHQLVPDATLDSSAVLHQHVTKLTHTVDKLRDRISQMTRWIAELEKDRHVIIKSLNKSPKSSSVDKSKADERFAEYVVDSLSKLHIENADLEAELNSLRQRMTSMADEQVTMIQKLANKTSDEQQQHTSTHAHSHKTHAEGDDDRPLQPSMMSKAMSQRRRGSSTPSVTASPQVCSHHPKTPTGRSTAKLSVVSSTSSLKKH